MSLKPYSIILVLALVVLWISETGIRFEESMASVQEAGYPLKALNAPDMRCLQGLERDGTRVVFMQDSYGIEDYIDRMNFGINPAYSPRGNEKMLGVLELIGFPLRPIERGRRNNPYCFVGRCDLTFHGKKPGNSAACGGGEWTGESSIWLCQTAVGFFLGISPGRIGGISLRNKIEELSL